MGEFQSAPLVISLYFTKFQCGLVGIYSTTLRLLSTPLHFYSTTQGFYSTAVGICSTTLHLLFTALRFHSTSLGIYSTTLYFLSTALHFYSTTLDSEIKFNPIFKMSLQKNKKTSQFLERF